ncbi:S phase cyclin A-associated protein in the endoplasmic reticulum [Pseudoscourfieldia marina]
MRKTPQETKRIAMAKQARAEALRGQQLDARIARATARRDSQGQSARQTEEEKQQQQERLRMELDERDRRKHELRRAYIDAIAQRAGDENRKVEEVAFLARLEEENKRLRTQQKLEDARRGARVSRRNAASVRLSTRQARKRARGGSVSRRNSASELPSRRANARRLLRSSRMSARRRARRRRRAPRRLASRQRHTLRARLSLRRKGLRS